MVWCACPDRTDYLTYAIVMQVGLGLGGWGWGWVRHAVEERLSVDVGVSAVHGRRPRPVSGFAAVAASRDALYTVNS